MGSNKLTRNIEITMNTSYSIDLTLQPTTLDLWHVVLVAGILLLSFILIIVLISIILSMGKGANKAAQKEQPAPHPPEPKIIEKIVEVEKIVKAPAPEPVVLKEATPDAALQLLSMLQKEARFIDFIKEDVSAYSDADVGVAARVVHEGCKKIIDEHFVLNVVRTEQEGSRITLNEGFDAASVRLTGNITGQAPFNGTLVHKGWQVIELKMPKLTEGHNPKIVAAAEVEL